MADFALNEDQLQIQKWVHGFAEDVMRPAAHEWDEREEMPMPIVQQAAEIGLYGWEFLMNAMADTSGLTLPVAIDTARIEKESRGLWSMFTGPDQLAALEKSITASLATKAASAPMLARQREAARATVAEFVQKWLMTQTDWKPHAGKKVEVLFADEPIDALDATCGGRPGCAAERLNAAGL